MSRDALWAVHPGDPRSCVIVHVPHASRHIPPRERPRIVLDDAALERELDAITDAHTDWLSLAASDAAALRPWLLVNGASRLLVDPERFPDEREQMLARGMGAVYTHATTRAILRQADAADDAHLIDTYYKPYAAAFEQLTTERLAVVRRVCIVDGHTPTRGGPCPTSCTSTNPGRRCASASTRSTPPRSSRTCSAKSGPTR